MIITISGLSGCGKNTVGELVSKRLSLRHIKFTFKDEAARRGISLMELQKLASKNPRLDREFDRRLVSEASKGGCVVTTWLGSWMIKNAGVRVWLKASEKERARRVAGRDGISIRQALKHVRERDKNNIFRYKKYYGINILDHEFFDLEINSARFTPEQIAGIIVSAATARK